MVKDPGKDLEWLWRTVRETGGPLREKRVRKLAAQLSDDAIKRSLGLDTHPEAARYLHVVETANGPELGTWREGGDRMCMFGDDAHPVLRYAQISYLRRSGFPVFQSYHEAEAFARRQFKGR
jgi:hypothetical protein